MNRCSRSIRRALTSEVFECIEGSNNPRRRHSTLGMLSPSSSRSSTPPTSSRTRAKTSTASRARVSARLSLARARRLDPAQLARIQRVRDGRNLGGIERDVRMAEPVVTVAGVREQDAVGQAAGG